MQEDILRLQREVAELKMNLSVQGQAVNYGVDLRNLTNLFEVVTTAPTETPTSVYEQVKLHYNSTGPVMRLYMYDNVNAKWNYVALTIV